MDEQDNRPGTINTDKPANVISVSSDHFQRKSRMDVTPPSRGMTMVAPEKSCANQETAETYNEVTAFLARCWNTPSHIPLETDPTGFFDADIPGGYESEARLVEALRETIIVIKQMVDKIQEANIYFARAFVFNGPEGEFESNLLDAEPRDADRSWVAAQLIDALMWAEDSFLFEVMPDHLQNLAPYIMSDLVTFIQLGIEEIASGQDINDTFGDDFGVDMEIVAANENMPITVVGGRPDA